MNSHRLLAFAATASLSLIALVSAQSQNGELKPPYTRTGQEVTVTGSVAFKGDAPDPRTFDTRADPVCSEQHPNLTSEWLMVQNGRVANVVVYVVNESVLGNYSFQAPTTAVVLEHRGCRYQPHVLGIQVGQSVSIVNSDNTHHNTHPTPMFNKEWNQTQPPGAPPITQTFTHPEVAITVRDNQHPWEKAYVAVFKHPYFSITDANGEFKIEGLPPGQYELIAWHEEMSEKKMQLTVLPGQSKSVAFSFDRSDIKENSRLLQR